MYMYIFFAILPAMIGQSAARPELSLYYGCKHPTTGKIEPLNSTLWHNELFSPSCVCKRFTSSLHNENEEFYWSCPGFNAPADTDMAIFIEGDGCMDPNTRKVYKESTQLYGGVLSPNFYCQCVGNNDSPYSSQRGTKEFFWFCTMLHRPTANSAPHYGCKNPTTEKIEPLNSTLWHNELFSPSCVCKRFTSSLHNEKEYYWSCPGFNAPADTDMAIFMEGDGCMDPNTRKVYKESTQLYGGVLSPNFYCQCVGNNDSPYSNQRGTKEFFWFCTMLHKPTAKSAPLETIRKRHTEYKRGAFAKCEMKGRMWPEGKFTFVEDGWEFTCFCYLQPRSWHVECPNGGNGRQLSG